jgi:hypothetical protein
MGYLEVTQKSQRLGDTEKGWEIMADLRDEYRRNVS